MKKVIDTKTYGVKEGWTRQTFIVRQEHVEKIRALAYRKGKKKKDILDEALTEYFKNRRVKPLKIE